jgi:hypothetical protein
MEPLAFASVQVQELQRGTTTKEDGTYELRLEEGKYNLVFSMVGYQTRTVTLVVAGDQVLNRIMEEDETSLGEVVVRGKRKDGAEEIIRNVIRQKDKITSAAGPWSCKVYIKATQQDSSGKNNSVSKRKATNAKVEIRRSPVWPWPKFFSNWIMHPETRLKREPHRCKEAG